MKGRNAPADMPFVVVARERECGAEGAPRLAHEIRRLERHKNSRVKKTVKFRAANLPVYSTRSRTTRSFVDRAVRTHDTPNTTMFRKTLIFATVLLAFAATHAEDAPKITHKVRRAAHFQATRSRLADSTSGRREGDVRRRRPDVAEIPENVFTKKKTSSSSRAATDGPLLHLDRGD